MDTGRGDAGPGDVRGQRQVNGQLFVAGGQSRLAELATLSVYDPVSDAWTARAPLPTTRTQAAGAAAGGRFFVIGGKIAGVQTPKVVAYTP